MPHQLVYDQTQILAGYPIEILVYSPQYLCQGHVVRCLQQKSYYSKSFTEFFIRIRSRSHCEQMNYMHIIDVVCMFHKPIYKVLRLSATCSNRYSVTRLDQLHRLGDTTNAIFKLLLPIETTHLANSSGLARVMLACTAIGGVPSGPTIYGLISILCICENSVTS